MLRGAQLNMPEKVEPLTFWANMNIIFKLDIVLNFDYDYTTLLDTELNFDKNGCNQLTFRKRFIKIT